MKRVSIIGFYLALALVLSMTFISALDTQINVRARTFEKVSIFVLADSDTYKLLGSAHKPTGTAGNVSYTYSGSETTIKVNVKTSDLSGKMLLFESFGSFPTGSPLYLQIRPGNISNDYRTLESSESTITDSSNTDSTLIVNNANARNSSEDSSNGIIGSVVKGFETIKEKIADNRTVIYYVIGGILLAGLIFFAVGKIKGRKAPYIKYSFQKETPEEKRARIASVDEKKLLNAEEKIKEAQEEITEIRERKNKVENAKKKMKEAEKELAELGEEEPEEDEE